MFLPDRLYKKAFKWLNPFIVGHVVPSSLAVVSLRDCVCPKVLAFYKGARLQDCPGQGPRRVSPQPYLLCLVSCLLPFSLPFPVSVNQWRHLSHVRRAATRCRSRRPAAELAGRMRRRTSTSTSTWHWIISVMAPWRCPISGSSPICHTTGRLIASSSDWTMSGAVLPMAATSRNTPSLEEVATACPGIRNPTIGSKICLHRDFLSIYTFVFSWLIKFLHSISCCSWGGGDGQARHRRRFSFSHMTDSKIRKKKRIFKAE